MRASSLWKAWEAWPPAHRGRSVPGKGEQGVGGGAFDRHCTPDTCVAGCSVSTVHQGGLKATCVNLSTNGNHDGWSGQRAPSWCLVRMPCHEAHDRLVNPVGSVECLVAASGHTSEPHSHVKHGCLLLTHHSHCTATSQACACSTLLGTYHWWTRASLELPVEANFLQQVAVQHCCHVL